VINLFVLEIVAASFARVSAALNVPLGHEMGQISRLLWLIRPQWFPNQSFKNSQFRAGNYRWLSQARLSIYPGRAI
jgi:hypothetical protein